MTRNIYDRFRRITTNHIYLPEVDGIRFLAILLVVLFHIHGYFLKKVPFALDGRHTVIGRTVDQLLIHGDCGVHLFFVLSAFIICLPFAHHYINHGQPVDVKRYFVRRLTRLEPPYIIAITGIAIMSVTARIFPLRVLVPHWLASVAFVHNVIYHAGSIITVVAWSLEVEIQFYIIAPLLFKLLGFPPIVRRSALIIGSAAVIWMHFHLPLWHFKSLYRFAQFFFCGVLLADIYVSDFARTSMNKKWMPFVGIVCLAVVMFTSTDNYRQSLAGSLLVYLSPFILAFFCYIVLKNNIVKKIFSYKLIPVIGGMSYSIYLLHYSVISLLGRIFIKVHLGTSFLPNLIFQTILLLIPILILSGLYYLYIEQPFMSPKWVDKLMRKDKKQAEPA